MFRFNNAILYMLLLKLPTPALTMSYKPSVNGKG